MPDNRPRSMHAALVSLQARHLNALKKGEGRGLSTVEMAEHLQRESGFDDLYEALEAFENRHSESCASLWDNDGIFHHDGDGGTPCDCEVVKVRAVLAKARGEKP